MSAKSPHRAAVRYADELNVYADEDLLRYTRQEIETSGREVELSVYRHYDWDKWPADLAGDLEKWANLGGGRVFVNIGFGADLVQRVTEVVAAVRGA